MESENGRELIHTWKWHPGSFPEIPARVARAEQNLDYLELHVQRLEHKISEDRKVLHRIYLAGWVIAGELALMIAATLFL